MRQAISTSGAIVDLHASLLAKEIESLKLEQTLLEQRIVLQTLIGSDIPTRAPQSSCSPMIRTGGLAIVGLLLVSGTGHPQTPPAPSVLIETAAPREQVLKRTVQGYGTVATSEDAVIGVSFLHAGSDLAAAGASRRGGQGRRGSARALY